MKRKRTGNLINVVLISAMAFLILASASLVRAQTLQTLFSFSNTNGANPAAALTLGNDGNFYGTTYSGGGYGYGTVFKVTIDGTLTTLVAFASTNGANPNAALTMGDDGNLYGTTSSGGSAGIGTVFRMTTNGTLATLVSFLGTNGWNPQAALTLGKDGSFYGTTRSGGSKGDGTVFSLATNGVLTTLFSFSLVDTNGASPQTALTLGNDGNYYGTTSQGGNGNYGTIFKCTTTGNLTTLVSFDSYNNGASPKSALVLA